MLTTHRCPNCGAPGMTIFYELERVPVHSVLLMPTRKEALEYPKGDIRLGFCDSCGFIANTTFDPGLHEYSERYEETQGFSPTFNSFSYNLARRLIERYDLHGKDIIEIGCGKGEFLTLICQLGANRGIGIDPAYVSERSRAEKSDLVTFIADFYSEQYSHLRADFVICKMTLEHIPDTAGFVGMVRRAIGDRPETTVFFQIPDVRRVLSDIAFWDIYYEHCSYFSPQSLSRLFRQSGFDVLAIGTEYDDQYLMIEARPGQGQSFVAPQDEGDLDALRRSVQFFTQHYRQRLDRWKGYVQELWQNGRRVVLWGSGSKGVAFLTTLGLYQEIEFTVDINPHKHGTFMAGTGQEIVAPEFLREYRPDVVIIMNGVYRQEIQQRLDAMGVAAEVTTVDEPVSV